jgi:excisionase family DNA binding protein
MNLFRAFRVYLNGGRDRERKWKLISKSPVFTVSRSPVLSVPELAEYLKVGPATIYRLLKRRELPGYRVGSEWRFNLESIDRWRRGREADVEQLHLLRDVEQLRLLNEELERLR